ncbi:uncharacterized protein IL334_007599 [Kwoniella shivajii]|uniref:Uncharacterized protein n=1 Tax=Kwoniella shivajii TaxID=564305 RepID=A0ABZ1D940_9TREE|nr:hypothetical protein IL334_007599 [Kwoniella shivajii]
MPPRRSSRPSISSPTGGDDVSSLTLGQVRDRLNRNEALLNSPLFASPNGANVLVSPPTSPQIGVGESGPGPSTISFSSPQPNHDPVKDKLLLARESLLAREQELMMNNMQINENGHSERRKSGKERVIERIREDEGRLAKNGLILPIDQTLTLGQRDYQNATALSLSQLSLNHTRSSSPKPRRPNPHSSSRSGLGGADPFGGEDEISRANRLARLNAFMSYKSTDSDEEDFDDNEDYNRHAEDEDADGDDDAYLNKLREGNGDADIDIDIDGEGDFPLSGPASGGYDGNGLPLRTTDETGQEVDEFGEDDEIFLEGNDEYANGAGQGTLAAGPGR